jgi:hypothetical protein
MVSPWRNYLATELAAHGAEVWQNAGGLLANKPVPLIATEPRTSTIAAGQPTIRSSKEPSPMLSKRVARAHDSPRGS